MKINLIKKWIFGLVSISAFLLNSQIFLLNRAAFGKSPTREIEKSVIQPIEGFLRTELYFGMNKTDGSVVTEDEWNKFLFEEVTPRFPAGFTDMQANGQYQNSSGVVVKEHSRVLILLYPLNSRKSSNRKIEQIRREYKQKFLQESVLRLDFPQSVRISF